MTDSNLKRTCRTCGVPKPHKDYYDAPANADGLATQCKECKKAHALAYRAKHIDRIRIRDRKRQRDWRTDEQRERGREWRRNNRDIYNTHRRLAYAIKHGKIERKPCEVCGTRVRVVGHQNSYTGPLDVTWLCGIHHNAAMKEQAT